MSRKYAPMSSPTPCAQRMFPNATIMYKRNAALCLSPTIQYVMHMNRNG